ncbi:PD-(D/E)XK nuclease family protein [Lentiprolixibacter aurantiacus]|uniref:PD-(D/E)XK nuclease family protein n=1 Tax=Lentiprolixibacter aurantiacus TaxID=2993939 RepID=A0AAE3SMK7_9FLAO|nr:PD-(D/E)XK nuclease family protein [Lentiprolixibacter aurantiacus]MCX2718396.1 PD-(D/E)XK nuclease family protein [Lentiprolixibacter aurantiacus]
MTSFLKEVAQSVCSENRNIEQYIFVLPSKRAGNFLKTHLASEIGKTIFAPKVYSVEEFIQLIAGQESASRIDLLFTLYEAYLKVAGKEPESYDSFVSWGNTLLQDIMEIDRYLIPPEKVFTYLSAIQEMNHWSLASEKTAQISGYLKFWELLHPIYEHFTAKLVEKGKGHQGLLYKLAVERLDSYLLKTKGQRHIFAGFNALNQAESRIIQTILGESDANIYWDTDPYFLNNPVHDAGYFLRQYFSNWPFFKSNPPKETESNFLKNKKIQITGIPKQVAQAKYVGSLLSEILQNKPEELNNTALILGDENLLNPILHALPDGLDKVNITMGYPLSQTAAATLIIQWIDLFISQDKQGWYHKPFLNFLTHPAIQGLLYIGGDRSAPSLRTKLVESNTTYITLKTLRNYLSDNTILDILFENKNSPLKFIEDGLALLAEFRQSENERTGLIASQAYIQMEKVLRELKSAVQDFPYVNDLKSMKGLLLEIMSSKSLDLVGDPASGLQIMGMLEGRNLDFSTVIITSVNEGILPAGKSVNSFIPFDVKRELGLPTYKEKDAVYTYHFYRILQRAQNIILCYNTEPDTLEGGEKSRLIYQLTTDPNITPFITQVIASPKVPLQTTLLTRITKDEFIMEKISELAKRGFSPTALSDYIRDPLTFFKRHLLGVDDPDDIEETLEARTFGTIVHECLESLYKPFVGSILNAEALGKQRKKVKPLVRSLMSDHYPGQSSIQGKNLIAFEVIVKYIDRFMAREMEECGKHEIRLIALETRMKQHCRIPSLQQEVFIKGTVDRIDEYDGTLRILDYKTGTVKPSEVEVVDWKTLIRDKNHSKAFQLLCYAWLYNREKPINNIQAGIISIKSIERGAITFAKKDSSRSRTKDSRITPEVIRIFEQHLTLLISEICNPMLPLEEEKN